MASKLKLVTFAGIAAIALTVSGCGLIPKKVELFQDKVHRVPEPNAKQKELQREAAQKANEKAAETLHAALAADASLGILVPAGDAEKLTAVVAESLGAPAKPTVDLETTKLVADLRAQLAKLERKMDAFREDNNESAGKKIEGTGLLQVPYFAWAGGFVLVVFVGWHLAKTALAVMSAANPGAAVGVGAMNVTGSLAGKGFAQVVAGGKEFLKWVENIVDDPALKRELSEAFAAAQKSKQDQEVRAVVDVIRK